MAPFCGATTHAQPPRDRIQKSVDVLDAGQAPLISASLLCARFVHHFPPDADEVRRKSLQPVAVGPSYHDILCERDALDRSWEGEPALLQRRSMRETLTVGRT